MTPLRFVLAGLLAGGALGAIEVAWLAAAIPAALAPYGGARAVALAFLPRAVFVGAAAGLLLGAAVFLGAQLARVGARWRGDRHRWGAALVSGALAIAVALLASTLLKGRQVRLGNLRFAVGGLLGALAGGVAFGLVRLSQRAPAWLADPPRGPARRRALRWAVPAVALAMTGGLYLVDRFVLVRLYEPFHLALRGGMFLALVGGVLAAVGLRRTDPGAVSRSGGRPKMKTAAALGIVLLCFLGARLDGARAWRALPLTVVTLHGAVGGTVVRLGELAAPTARNEQVAARRPTPAQTLRSTANRSPSVPLAPGANILLITVDALRADHLGIHGYARPTSPNIDRLAMESVVFERAYTSAPHTSFALTALLTGQPAMSFSELGILEGTPTLADLAGANGYHTAAFFSPAVFFVDGEKFKSFEERAFGFKSTFPDKFPESSSAPLQTDQVLAFLADRSPERFLLWVHYFAPHEPYLEHPEVGASFGRGALDRYDAEIRWTDENVGRLVRAVRGAHPNTIVVLTADHGEEFGDHGGAYHGTTLYDEQVRVPLIVSIPGATGRRVAAPVSTTSVVPTLLDLTGIPASEGFDGASLAAVFGPDRAAAEQALPVVFAENSGQRAAMAGTDKLLCTLRPDRCVLFDLAADPKELVDTAPARPDRAVQLMAELDAWEARQRKNRGGDNWAVVEDLTASVDARRTAARAFARSVERHRRTEVESAWRAEADPVVKAWLAVALGQLGETGIRATLAEVGDETVGDDELRAHVALARARVVGESAAPAVVAALSRATDVNLRCALMYALSEWRIPIAGEVLTKEYEVIRSRICCAEALTRLQDPSTVPFLLSRLLDEPYLTVQTALVRALGRLRDPAAIPKLRELREATPEPGLAEVVDTALAEIGADPSGT